MGGLGFEMKAAVLDFVVLLGLPSSSFLGGRSRLSSSLLFDLVDHAVRNKLVVLGELVVLVKLEKLAVLVKLGKRVLVAHPHPWLLDQGLLLLGVTNMAPRNCCPGSATLVSALELVELVVQGFVT